MSQKPFPHAMFKPLIAISLASFLGAAPYEIADQADYTTNIDTTSGESEIIFKGTSGTLSGNVSANGGNNTISFEQSGSFAITGNISANSTSKNTFVIDKDITLTSNLTLSGTASGDNGNTINLTNGKLILKSNQTLQTLFTQGGITHINFQAINQEFHGNIETTGGNTKINFLKSGSTFHGDITANGGNNTLNLTEGLVIFGDGLTTYGSTLNALGSSSNTLNLSNTITIDGVLHLKGVDTSNNTFNLSANSSLSFDTDNTGDQNIILEGSR